MSRYAERSPVAFDMLTREMAASMFDVQRRHATADEIELLIAGSRNALTRFANNTIHQNIEEQSQQISVRGFVRRAHRALHNQQVRRREPAPSGAIRRCVGKDAAGRARPVAHAEFARDFRKRGSLRRATTV